MSRYVKIALLKALIKTKDSPRPTWGICQNVDRNILIDLGGYANCLTELFKSWPKYSGNPSYPVPLPGYEYPDNAYNDIDMLWEGAYGDLRRELLDHCISELKKELKNDAE